MAKNTYSHWQFCLLGQCKYWRCLVAVARCSQFIHSTNCICRSAENHFQFQQIDACSIDCSCELVRTISNANSNSTIFISIRKYLHTKKQKKKILKLLLLSATEKYVQQRAEKRTKRNVFNTNLIYMKKNDAPNSHSLVHLLIFFFFISFLFCPCRYSLVSRNCVCVCVLPLNVHEYEIHNSQ